MNILTVKITPALVLCRFLCLSWLICLGLKMDIQAADDTVTLARLVAFFEDNTANAKNPDPNKITFKALLRKAYPAGQESASGQVLPDFDEKRILPQSVGKGMLDVVFDQVILGDYSFPQPKNMAFLDNIELKQDKGSINDPNLIKTADGHDIYSLRICFRSSKDISYNLVSFDRDSPDILGVILNIMAAQPVPKPSQMVTPKVEIAITDVDLKVATPIGMAAANPAARQVLEQLAGTPDSQFVTVIAPLMYIQPSRVQTLLTHKLSLLGTIQVDNDNPAIMITDRADYVRSILATIPLLDRPQPQVSIDVKILEVAWQKDERLGFSWGGKRQDTSSGKHPMGSFTTSTPAASGGSFGSGMEAIIGRSGDGLLEYFSMQIDALSSQNRINLLANPKIVVANNSKATFHAGSKIPVYRQKGSTTTGYFQSTGSIGKSPLPGISPDDINPTGFTSQQNYNVNQQEETVEVGIKLTITPRIMPGGRVQLEMTPSVSEIVGWRQGTESPIINTREVTTTIGANDGDTVFLAGLFRENAIAETAGIPGLQSIPGIGRVFQGKSSTKTHNEVIFLLQLHIDWP